MRASLYIEFGREFEELTGGTKTVTAEEDKSGLNLLRYREVKKAAAVKSKLLGEIPPKSTNLKKRKY